VDGSREIANNLDFLRNRPGREKMGARTGKRRGSLSPGLPLRNWRATKHPHNVFGRGPETQKEKGQNGEKRLRGRGYDPAEALKKFGPGRGGEGVGCPGPNIGKKPCVTTRSRPHGGDNWQKRMWRKNRRRGEGGSKGGG